MIKPQYQNQYIFLADPTVSGSIDITPAPMTVSQLDEFLRAQCSDIGIATQGIKMKSFYRSALIDLESRVGSPTVHMMLDEKLEGWQPKWYGTQHDELLGLWFRWTELLLTPYASDHIEDGPRVKIDAANPKGKERRLQASHAADRAVDRGLGLRAEQNLAEQDTVADVFPEQTNESNFETQVRALMNMLVKDETLF
jgi:hypothetical protein